MFNERILSYITVAIMMFVLTWGGLRNIEEFLLKNRDRKTAKYLMCISLIVLALVYNGIMMRLPAVVNIEHTVKKGTLMEFETAEHVNKYQSAKNLYDITLKEQNSGKYIRYKSVRVPNPEKGREVELYLFRTQDFTDIVAKIDGEPTKYYKRALPSNRFEKIIIFLMVAMHTVILATMSGKEYFQVGKRKYGTKWYLLGMLGLAGYAVFTGIGILDKYNNLIIGEIIGDSFVVYCIAHTLLVVCIHKDEYSQEKMEEVSANSVTQEQKNESGLVPAKVKTGMKTIQFEQMSQTEAERYCKYKYNARRKSKDVRNDIEIMEYLYILIGIFVFVFLESVQRELAICGLLILFVITPFVIMKYFNKKYMPIKKASRSSCEYVFTTARIEKYIKCICVDGHKIFWCMDCDDDYEVRNGDKIAVVYLSATRQLFTEKADTIKKILEEK